MKMKAALVAIIGCAALCLAVPAMAQYSPGQYWGEYNGPPITDGQVVVVKYTGPYETTYAGEGAGLYGGSVNGHTAAIVCDDFYDHISQNQSWSATAYQASNLASTFGSTLFGGSIGLAGYAELTTLASLLLSHGAGPITFEGTSYDHGQINAAMWAITSGISVDTQVQALINAVAAVVGSNSNNLSGYLSQFKDIFVMTPTWKRSDQGDRPQETWVQVSASEGGAALLYLLLAGMTCLGAMRFGSQSKFGQRAI